MRIGVLGGTFDPPHLAHLVVAAAARRALVLDRVRFVPAGDPWRKSDREVTAAAARVRMTAAAIEGLPWAELSTVEVERSGPSYSVETLEAFAAEGHEWWFLLGSDALADLPHWREPARLVSLARLGLVARPDGGATVPEAVAAAVPGIEAQIDLVPAPLLDISSTVLRARVRAGQPTEPLLPVGVRRVIEEFGLYR